MYLDVEENNAETDALFAPNPGNGSPTVVGNQITFDPQGFASQSENLAADLLDSTLTTVIMAKPGKAINTVVIEEFGDYSLSGLGAAEASVGAAFFVTILEVDGEPVSGIPVKTQNMAFTSGGGANGGEYELPGDQGSAVIWNGTAFIDIADHLSDNNVGGAATKVRLRFDNTLTTAAATASTAFIKKKELGGVIITVNEDKIPEPSTIALAGLAVLGLFVRRRCSK